MKPYRSCSMRGKVFIPFLTRCNFFFLIYIFTSCRRGFPKNKNKNKTCWQWHVKIELKWRKKHLDLCPKINMIIRFFCRNRLSPLLSFLHFYFFLFSFYLKKILKKLKFTYYLLTKKTYEHKFICKTYNPTQVTHIWMCSIPISKMWNLTT